MCRYCEMVQKSWEKFALETMDPNLPLNNLYIIKLYWLYGAHSILETLGDAAHTAQFKAGGPMRHICREAFKESKRLLEDVGVWLHTHQIPTKPPGGQS